MASTPFNLHLKVLSAVNSFVVDIHYLRSLSGPAAPETDWHLVVAAFCLKFLNSCANPIALYCVSGVFRKKFDRYLGWLVAGGRRRRSSGSILTSSGTTPPRRASRPRGLGLHSQRPGRRHGGCQRTRTTLVTTFMNGAGNGTYN